jgi:hypothetical protein
MQREKVSHPCFVLCKSKQAAHATQRANFPPCCGLLGIEDVVRVRVVAQQCKVLSARPATGSSPHRARMVSCTLMLPRWRWVAGASYDLVLPSSNAWLSQAAA